MSDPSRKQQAQRLERPYASADMSDEELIRHCRQFISCETCGKVHPTLRCSRCQLVHYCSRKCQAAHWKGTHKSQCSPFENKRKELRDFEGSSTRVEANEQKRRQVLEANPKCAICFEQPMVQPVVLDQCHHAFCFPCLQNWNNAHQGTQPRFDFVPSATTTSSRLTCPLCRREIPNVGESIIQDILLLLTSAQKLNAPHSFVVQECAKALEKMELLKKIEKSEEDTDLKERYQHQLLYFQLNIHKLRKEYDKALKFARQSEELLRSAAKNDMAIEACVKQLVAQSDPESQGKILQKIGDLSKKPNRSPKLHVDAILQVAEIQILQEDWHGVHSTIQAVVNLYVGEGSNPLPCMTNAQHRDIFALMSRQRFEVGNYKGAIELGTTVITMNRNYPGCHQYVVLSYLACGNMQREAQQCAAEAVIYEATWDEEHHTVAKEFYRKHFTR